LIEGRYDVHTRFKYSFEDPNYRNLEREEALKEELKKKPELAEVIVRPPGQK